MTTTTNDLTEVVEKCERLVTRLSATSGIAFKFGYIGNCDGRGYDDRGWYAFAAHPGRVGNADDRIGGYRTSELAELIPVLQGALEMAKVVRQAR